MTVVSAAADETLRFWEIMGQPVGAFLLVSTPVEIDGCMYECFFFKGGIYRLLLRLPPACKVKQKLTHTHTNTEHKTTDKKKEFMGNGVLLPPLNPAIMPRGASGFSGIR